jgi:Uma2 family endonuclease
MASSSGVEARVRIRKDPDSTVGIDLAYLSPDLASQTPEGAKFVDGPPTLAVEILSPSDTYGELSEKVRAYLDAGVPLVWVVDPSFRTIVVYRPDAHPKLLNVDDAIDAEPLLPGFRAEVARIFRR